MRLHARANLCHSLRRAATLLVVALAMFSYGVRAQAAAPIQSAALYQVPAPFKSWLVARFVTQDDADTRALLLFMQGYYMHPAPSAIPDFLRAIDKAGVLEKHPNAFAVLSGFICRLAEMNPEFIHIWFPATADKGATAPYGKKTMAMLQYAIWRAGHLNDSAIAKFFTEKPVYLSTTPGTLAASAVRTQDDVDMMWGAFLASGDVFFVDKVIDALPSVPTAAATLKANALNHDIVLRALEKRLEKAQDDDTRKRLDALLPQTTPGRNFAVHDGNFGAEIIAAPLESIMAQIEKPAEEQLKFQSTPHVTSGEKIGFLIVYSGVGLDDTLHGNVDFDMTLTAPDGAAMAGSVLSRKTAFDGRLQSRFSILHTPSFLGVEFTPKDKLGTYVLNATLRDNISGRALPLQAKIQLVQKDAAPTAEKAAEATPSPTPQKHPTDYSRLNH